MNIKRQIANKLWLKKASVDGWCSRLVEPWAVAACPCLIIITLQRCCHWVLHYNAAVSEYYIITLQPCCQWVSHYYITTPLSVSITLLHYNATVTEYYIITLRRCCHWVLHYYITTPMSLSIAFLAPQSGALRISAYRWSETAQAYQGRSM